MLARVQCSPADPDGPGFVFSYGWITGAIQALGPDRTGPAHAPREVPGRSEAS